MVKATLYYKQTPRERYESSMSDDVSQVLKDFDLTVEGADGGMSLADYDDYAPDEQIAEEEFFISGSRMSMRLAANELEARYERPFQLTYTTLWKKIKTNVWWKMHDWGLVK